MAVSRLQQMKVTEGNFGLQLSGPYRSQDLWEIDISLS